MYIKQYNDNMIYKIGQNAFQTETISFRTRDVIPDYLKKKFSRINIISEMYMIREKENK